MNRAAGMATCQNGRQNFGGIEASGSAPTAGSTAAVTFRSQFRVWVEMHSTQCWRGREGAVERASALPFKEETMRAIFVRAAVVAAMMLTGLGANVASAAGEANSESPATVVVDGREFGPEEGLRVTTETYKVTPGDGSVERYYPTTPTEGSVSPQATWGSSYAISNEYVSYYRGRAKAAGNVYYGERIIRVCVWYSNPGRSSDTVCSNASSSGGQWHAGSEATVQFIDNLSVNWPDTNFNIRTTRIDPRFT